MWESSAPQRPWEPRRRRRGQEVGEAATPKCSARCDKLWVTGGAKKLVCAKLRGFCCLLCARGRLRKRADDIELRSFARWDDEWLRNLSSFSCSFSLMPKKPIDFLRGDSWICVFSAGLVNGYSKGWRGKQSSWDFFFFLLPSPRSFDHLPYLHTLSLPLRTSAIWD